MNESAQALVLHALAEPRRRAILRLIGDRELPAGEIARRFEVTRPAISQHLRVLREAGLVEERRDGTRRLYRARRERVEELRDYLAGFWGGRLRLLREQAESESFGGLPIGEPSPKAATPTRGARRARGSRKKSRGTNDSGTKGGGA
ncbi:MAG: metalloregulator ArsR/SmtB family transcription factor [Chloroflexi bacterium]|nr:metalloregulator ArsR/SmtB family transcription factor [Chloroflexota bacterium]